MIAGISVASIIIVAALIFGSVALYSSLQKDTASAQNSSGDTPDPFDTDEGETTGAVLPSETEATETAEATLSQNEIDANTYGQYITDTLAPTYGLANLDMFLLDCSWWAGFMDLHEFMPDDRKGIVSAQIEDMNGDGNVELIVVIAGTYGDPVIHTNDYDDYVYETHYDGFSIKVFQIVGGVVEEMICDNKEMVYSDIFMYAQDESVQISVLENGSSKYIYVFKYSLPISEQSSERFQHDIYQVTETGVHCMDSVVTMNGIIYDGLDASSGYSNGTEVFSIWDGDAIADYYNTLTGQLTPYGLDCSWMDSYYDVIQVDTDWETTFSRGINHAYTPLSAMVSNIRVVSMIGGDCEYDPDHGVTTQSYFLLNLADGPIAQPARQVPVPNAQVETEVTVIRDIWTQDRDNITADLYTVTTVAPGIVAYHNGSEIVMIEIAEGTGGNPFSRTYEYVNGELIFAFITKTGQQNRLYFYDQILFRWRFTDGASDPVNYDNAVSYAKFITWERKAREEAMLVLAQANGL